jgi:hypothetical protein
MMSKYKQEQQQQKTKRYSTWMVEMVQPLFDGRVLRNVERREIGPLARHEAEEDHPRSDTSLLYRSLTKHWHLLRTHPESTANNAGHLAIETVVFVSSINP